MGKSWLVRWLGLAAVPLAAGGVCLYLGLAPYTQGPQADAPAFEGFGEQRIICPLPGDDAAWAEIEDSAPTNPRDQACLDALEEGESFRSTMTTVGIGSVVLGVAVLAATLFVRSGREHRRLEAELARRRAEAGLDSAPQGPHGPIGPIS